MSEIYEQKKKRNQKAIKVKIENNIDSDPFYDIFAAIQQICEFYFTALQNSNIFFSPFSCFMNIFSHNSKGNKNVTFYCFKLYCSPKQATVDIFRASLNFNSTKTIIYGEIEFAFRLIKINLL